MACNCGKRNPSDFNKRAERYDAARAREVQAKARRHGVIVRLSDGSERAFPAKSSALTFVRKYGGEII